MKLTFPLVAALVCAAVPAFAVPVSIAVVGPDNKPLAGAKLDAFEFIATSNEPDKPIADVAAGADGVFRWEWGGAFDAAEVPSAARRQLHVKVSAPGMVVQHRLLKREQTTIVMQAAREWSGVVLEQNQKPVAGVTLQLTGFDQETAENAGDSGGNRFYFSGDEQTAVTDANGRWTMKGLPLRGKARVTIRDARVVSERLDLAIGEGEAAPIYLKQGATIAGVLRAPDGSPVVGEKVSAGFGEQSLAVTDADGRFLVSGVAPGEIELYIGDLFLRGREGQAPPAFLFDRVTGVAAKAGQTTDVGEIKAQKGVLLTARIVDNQTKLPLPGARFFDDWGNSTGVISGADGTLQVRVLPSRLGRDSSRPNIKSQGYIDYEIIAPNDLAAATLDLGTVALGRGAVVTGTVRLEGDAKAEGRLPSISLSREGKYDFIWPAEDGKFSSKALAAGSYNVNLNAGDGNWQIVSPRTATVPEAGKEAKPIEVIVKRLTPFLPLIKEVRGRLLDANGQGVAGATIKARLKTEIGNFYAPSALTDANGFYAFEDRGQNVVGAEIESAQHPIYLVGGKAEVSVEDGIATVTGLSAKKRGAVFTGRVVGADGKAAAGAWLAVLEARDYAPVRTGADGTFKLPDVPLDKFTLLAAHNREWAQLPIESSAATVKIELNSSSGVTDRAAVIAALMQIPSNTGLSVEKVLENWDALGADVVEQFLRRDGAPRPAIVAMFGAELARRQPALFLKRAPELLDGAKGEAREDLEAQLNLLRAASDDAGLRTDANAWLNEQTQVKREIKPRSVMQLLQMAAVAQRLGRADAAQWLDYAAALNAQLKGNAESNTYAWSATLGAFDYPSLARFAEDWKPSDEFQLWSYLAPVMARAGDVKGARQALARVETLMAEPEMAQFAQNARKYQRADPTRTLNEVRSAVAGALARRDAPAAFALADQIKDVYPRAKAMLKVADGAGAANALIAEKALRDVMQARSGNIELFSMAASIGAQISPQLGEELFALALEKSLPDPARRSSFRAPTIGTWAFYHAPYDAAHSRVLIEREWNWRLPAATKSKNDSFSSDVNALYELIKGMAAVDPARAAQMRELADAIETKSYGQKAGQFDLAVITLSTPAQRARMGVDSRY